MKDADKDDQKYGMTSEREVSHFCMERTEECGKEQFMKES